MHMRLGLAEAPYESMESEVMAALVARARGEYREMPGLRLTIPQAARLLGMPQDVARTVLDHLRHSAVLTRSADGVYSLTEP